MTHKENIQNSKGEINTTIKKGINTVILEDAQHISQEQIHQKKKELLKPLVRDEQILDILASDENFNKLQTRLEYKAIIKDNKAMTLATAETYHPQTLMQTLNQLQRVQKETEINKDLTDDGAAPLKEANWINFDRPRSGLIERVNLQITIRKG